VTQLEELGRQVVISHASAAAEGEGAVVPTAHATLSLADLVAAVLSNPQRPDPTRLPVPDDDRQSVPVDQLESPAETTESLLTGPIGLGTSAARVVAQTVAPGAAPHVAGRVRQRFTGRPSGVGTSAWWLPADQDTPESERAGSEASVPALFCPGPVRDDVVLGELVNEGLVAWAEEVGIYAGRLDKLRSYNFGRLIMLTHPASDDADVLLAATKCVVAEWATDDYYVDEVALGADPSVVGSRLALLTAVVDPRHLPVRYEAQLEEYEREEAIARAFRTSMAHMGQYMSATQLGRFQHQMATLFLAWTQEADWHRNGRTPTVWEYLVQRQLNSYLPPMILIDSVAGYELPPNEFYDPRVRRAFTTAGFANVLLNDLHSAAFESDTDFNLPRVIALEEKCSHEAAIARTVEIHNELMRSFVAEALALSVTGSPMLQRFFVDTWAWMGGSREWHATSGRYKAAGGE
jgi:2-methylisoborneol synthase